MATTTDDPRYAELFDVRREAQGMSNVADTDFNPLMNALRERGPVLKGSLRELLGLGGDSRYDTELPGYTALSFAACDRAFRENLLFSSEVYNDMPAVRKLGHVVLNKVGEPHKRMRAAAQSMFLKPAATGWWRRNWIDDAVKGLVDRLEGRDRADLNIDLCARLPLQVVSCGVGLAGEEALIFREQLLKSIGNHEATPAERAEAAKAVDATLRGLVLDRRTHPRDDVVSGLARADFKEVDGTVRKLIDDEVLGFARHILLAGGGTTWRQLGITIHALLDQPEYWAAARADRALIYDAIEEAARWNATGPTFPRLVTEDTELEGVFIPANSRIDI